MSIFSKMIDKRIAAYHNYLDETHFAEVENMYNQVRGWRHDYRNHIQTMKSYATSGDMEAIIKFLDMLDADLGTIEIAVKTGNKTADALLNSKISLARAKKITVIADANIAYEIKTPELDLCIIIGNLFDNAIEACLALPENKREIRIYFEMKNTQLYMSFTNMTATKKQLKTEGRYKTTKGKGHGFGLVRIDDIIARHNGFISRNSEDNAFTTEVLLPQ